MGGGLRGCGVAGFAAGWRRAARWLLEEALQLPPTERARIAAELLSSLDEPDQDVKAAWAAEIARRAADAPDDEEDRYRERDLALARRFLDEFYD